MEIKVYTDVDKVFTCGQISITRQDFENMAGMLMAELCDDDTMQNIVNDVSNRLQIVYNTSRLEMLRLFRMGDDNKLTRNEIIECERMNDFVLEIMEEIAQRYGMCYWEELSDEEQDYLIDNYNF